MHTRFARRSVWFHGSSHHTIEEVIETWQKLVQFDGRNGALVFRQSMKHPESVGRIDDHTAPVSPNPYLYASEMQSFIVIAPFEQVDTNAASLSKAFRVPRKQVMRHSTIV